MYNPIKDITKDLIGKEITITQENAYEKYESLLKCILNDLKKAANQKKDNT